MASLVDTVPTRDLVKHFAATGGAAAPGFFNAAETAHLRQDAREIGELTERTGAHMIYRESSLLDPALKVAQRTEDFCPHHAGMDKMVRGGRLICGFQPRQDQQAGWSRYAPLIDRPSHRTE